MFGPNKHKQGTVVKVDKITANKNVSNTNLEKKTLIFYKVFIKGARIHTYIIFVTSVDLI